MYLEDIGLHAQNLLTIPGSMLNMIKVSMWPLNEHEILHFENG